VEGARHFDAFNGKVLDDGRVRIVVDDGINFLARSPRKWDAIIADGKSRHGHVGNARFYSEDFYRSGREHLSPGGLLLQWVPLDEPADELRNIARSCSRVFPHFYLWVAHKSAFMAGQEEPLSLDLSQAQRVLDAPETAGLRRHGWSSASEIASMVLLDAEAARPWLAQEDTVNSVERPTLEFYSPGAQAAPVSVRIAQNLESLELYRAAVAARPESVPARVNLSAALKGAGATFEAIQHAFQAVRLNPDSGIARHLYGGLLASIGSDVEAVKQLREAARIGPN